MKHLVSLVLLSLVVAGGCVRRYEITFTNQKVITSHGKPKVDKKSGTIRFKDVEGRQHEVPSFNILQIAPR
jgi:hypothetical protein